MNQVMAVALGSLLAVCAASAQDKAAAPEMSAEQKAQMEAFERMGAVREEHKALEYFVGSWAVKATMWMDPKAPPQESAATSKTEAMYGGRYFVTTYTGDFGGQPFQGHGMMGFDNLRGKYFSTWIDSMSTGFWLSWGNFDKASKTWTYGGEMPDPMQPSQMTKVRITLHVVDDKHYAFDWFETHDGKEAKTMHMDYTRQ